MSVMTASPNALVGLGWTWKIFYGRNVELVVLMRIIDPRCVQSKCRYCVAGLCCGALQQAVAQAHSQVQHQCSARVWLSICNRSQMFHRVSRAEFFVRQGAHARTFTDQCSAGCNGCRCIACEWMRRNDADQDCMRGASACSSRQQPELLRLQSRK
jgi:hypothetical protein